MDTDGDSILFKVNAGGKLDYHVNGQIKVANLTSLRDDDGILRLNGTSMGAWASNRRSKPRDRSIVQRVLSLCDTASQPISVAIVVEEPLEIAPVQPVAAVAPQLPRQPLWARVWMTCEQAAYLKLLHFCMLPPRLVLGLLELHVEILEHVLDLPPGNPIVILLLLVIGPIYLIFSCIENIAGLCQPYAQRQRFFDTLERDGGHGNSCLYSTQLSLAFLCRFGPIGANLGITLLGGVPTGCTERKGRQDAWWSQIRRGGQSALCRAFVRGQRDVVHLLLVAAPGLTLNGSLWASAIYGVRNKAELRAWANDRDNILLVGVSVWGARLRLVRSYLCMPLVLLLWYLYITQVLLGEGSKAGSSFSSASEPKEAAVAITASQAGWYSSGSAKFCEHSRLRGNCCTLSAGSYGSALTTSPCPANDKISSIQIEGDCKVAVFEHRLEGVPNGGRAWFLQGPGTFTPSSKSTNIFPNDQISHAIVCYLPSPDNPPDSCTPQLPAVNSSAFRRVGMRLDASSCDPTDWCGEACGGGLAAWSDRDHMPSLVGAGTAAHWAFDGRGKTRLPLRVSLPKGALLPTINVSVRFRTSEQSASEESNWAFADFDRSEVGVRHPCAPSVPGKGRRAAARANDCVLGRASTLYIHSPRPPCLVAVLCYPPSCIYLQLPPPALPSDTPPHECPARSLLPPEPPPPDVQRVHHGRRAPRLLMQGRA